MISHILYRYCLCKVLHEPFLVLGRVSKDLLNLMGTESHVMFPNPTATMLQYLQDLSTDCQADFPEGSQDFTTTGPPSSSISLRLIQFQARDFFRHLSLPTSHRGASNNKKKPWIKFQSRSIYFIRRGIVVDDVALLSPT